MFVIPAAVADTERKFLFDVGARQRFLGAAPEVRLPFLDDTAIIQHGANVPGEIVGIGIVRVDDVSHLRGERENVLVAHGRFR